MHLVVLLLLAIPASSAIRCRIFLNHPQGNIDMSVPDCPTNMCVTAVLRMEGQDNWFGGSCDFKGECAGVPGPKPTVTMTRHQFQQRLSGWMTLPDGVTHVSVDSTCCAQDDCNGPLNG